MAEDMIYFSRGSKSYDVTRNTKRDGSSFEWTERDGNLFRRKIFSSSAMIWLCGKLKEASQVKGNFLKRWKLYEYFAEIYSSRNYNQFGRYIIISIQDKKRKIIIVPEMAFNAWWMDIAHKLENFIDYKR